MARKFRYEPKLGIFSVFFKRHLHQFIGKHIKLKPKLIKRHIRIMSHFAFKITEVSLFYKTHFSKDYQDLGKLKSFSKKRTLKNTKFQEKKN